MVERYGFMVSYREFKIMKEDYYWDLPTCMWCGEVCDLVEFINSPKEMWCYCKKCKVDTFHKPVNSGDEYDD